MATGATLWSSQTHIFRLPATISPQLSAKLDGQNKCRTSIRRTTMAARHPWLDKNRGGCSLHRANNLTHNPTGLRRRIRAQQFPRIRWGCQHQHQCQCRLQDHRRRGDTDVYAEEQALLAEINSATNSLMLANALLAQHHRGLLSKLLLSQGEPPP